MLVPVFVATGVMRIIEDALTLTLLIVVLLPVRAALPINPEVRPAEVEPEPAQD
jgi:hypothetical protein